MQNSGAGPGAQYMLGYLDAAKEMGYDINLVVKATKKWRQNDTRTNAINEWLIQMNLIKSKQKQNRKV